MRLYYICKKKKDFYKFYKNEKEENKYVHSQAQDICIEKKIFSKGFHRMKLYASEDEAYQIRIGHKIVDAYPEELFTNS